MAKRKLLQTNFSSGELAPDLAMRQDTDQYEAGAKSLLNRRCMIGGGTKRRPGTWWDEELVAKSRTVEWVVNQSTQYICAFSLSRMDAYLIDVTTGETTASGSVAGAPWSSNEIIADMDISQSGNEMIITHPDMKMQRIARSAIATFTRSDYAFTIGASGKIEQPYFKMVAGTITLAPSALTGAITLTASASAFTASHVGERVRYLTKEILITGFTSSTVLSGTVIETLPGTQTLTVTSTANFYVGDVVQGGTTGARGEITAIGGAGSMTVVIVRGLQQFTAETIIGPNGVTACSAVAPATPASVTDWDEQVAGAAYGYFGCVERHRSRLLFSGHATLGNALAGSSLGDTDSFDVGDASDADGFLEVIGDAGASTIVRMHSAEQLLLFTDRGPYYVPESASSPFRPSSLAFFPFGSTWIASKVRPRAFDGGVLFISGSLVIKAKATGDLNRSWDADEVSLLSSHIISNPIDLAVGNNFDGGQERYAFVVNDDGTIAVMQLIEAQKIRNIVPWSNQGSFDSVAVANNRVYAASSRVVNGPERWFLERFDQDVTLDLAVTVTNLTDIPTQFGSSDVNVITGDYHLGVYSAAIALVDPPPGPYTAGFNYDSELETLPPLMEDEQGSSAGDMKRIVECYVHVLSSLRFAANGYELQAYQVTDPLDQPPPRRTGPERFTFLGWEREPTILITQTDPLPLDILAIRSVVVA